MANCMTLDRMVIAPTARFPPYFSREELKHRSRMLSVDCMTKGATPSPTQGMRRDRRMRRFSFFSLSTVFFPHRNHTAHTALSAWDRMVARAAPATPMSNRKMNTGSSTMLVTAPITTVSMLILENPWAEIKAFMPSVSCTKMVPTA